MFEDDPLHTLDLKEWKNFQQELENDWPKGVILYQFIETRLQWELKEPNKHSFYVCCPEGIIRNGLVAFGKVVSKLLITLKKYNEAYDLNYRLYRMA